MNQSKSAQRKSDAEARQEAYAKLSPEQKLARLDKGGFRAVKQRAKLESQIIARRGTIK